MREKCSLFLGIALLVCGILLKTLIDFVLWATILVAIGAMLKMHYIVNKIANREYKPGFEMILLFTGLIVFFSGIFLRSQGSSFNTTFLTLPGITLKIFFIILFIKKIR